jgi:hypothetical protein
MIGVNFTVCVGLLDFNAADMFRMGMIEQFILNDVGAFELRIREISAGDPDVEINFETYLETARTEAFAATEYDCQVHVFDFRVNHTDPLGKFYGAYGMYTAHLGNRLVGRRFEPSVEIPERFSLSSHRLSILIERLWPPLVASTEEKLAGAQIMDQISRGYLSGHELYRAPLLKPGERRKLH